MELRGLEVQDDTSGFVLGFKGSLGVQGFLGVEEDLEIGFGLQVESEATRLTRCTSLQHTLPFLLSAPWFVQEIKHVGTLGCLGFPSSRF